MDLFGCATDECGRVEQRIEVVVDGCEEFVGLDPTDQVIVFAMFLDSNCGGLRVYANGFVDFLAVSTFSDHGHDQVLGGHEWQLGCNPAGDGLWIDHQATRHVEQGFQHAICRQECACERDATVGRVVEGALHPLHRGGPGGVLGFVNRETGRFVSIDYCGIMHGGVNQSLAQLQGNCGETTQLSIRAGQDTGEYLVQPALTDSSVSIPTGQKSYADSVDGRSFRVSSPSFFQVNVEQAAEAVQVVRRCLGLTPEDVLLDAYTGVGTFAVLLAPYVKKVIAVEESSAAVADSRENTVGIHNVEFVLGKTEEVLDQLAEMPNAVVLDPPRSGCRPEALHSLLRLAAPKVAYVSCDP